MSFKAVDVMRRASTILQDAGAVRWTAVELCDWLNEAQRAIVSTKANALSKSVVLDLIEGTKQTLPQDTYTMLSRVVRNISSTGTPGAAVRTIARRELMDAAIPGWHDPTKLPYAASVGSVWQDPMAQGEFYVIPGNDGTGRIEAIVGLVPKNVGMDTGATDPTATDSYTAESEFPDVYQGILLDLVLTRAFSKDSAAADAAQRAAAHLQLATQALTSLASAEAGVGLAYAYVSQAS